MYSVLEGLVPLPDMAKIEYQQAFCFRYPFLHRPDLGYPYINKPVHESARLHQSRQKTRTVVELTQDSADPKSKRRFLAVPLAGEVYEALSVYLAISP